MIDATCPLVTKVHVEAVKFAKEGYSLILIGHHDHDEVIGTLGEAPMVTQVVGSPEEVESLTVPDPDRVAYLTQTTLSLDETKDIIAALREEVSQYQGAGGAGYLLCHRESPAGGETRGFGRRSVAGGWFR